LTCLNFLQGDQKGLLELAIQLRTFFIRLFTTLQSYKGCFFKFGGEVGVEELIVNEPLVLKTQIFSNCRLKTQTTQKVRLDLNG
jgi:hypothetical protein